jgi:hypothetical protein
MRRTETLATPRAAWALVALTLLAGATRAEETHIVTTVGGLTITEGQLPEERPPGDRRWRHREARQPYAVLDGPGEIYLDPDPENRRWPGATHDRLEASDVVAIRLPEPRREVTGRLFTANADGTGMVALTFAVPERLLDPAGQPDAANRFARAKADHFDRLLNRQLPGTAWFRHRRLEALRALGQDERANIARPMVESTLDTTLTFFGGSRAIRENLQLDRPIVERPGQAAGAPVKLDAIQGITVAAIDWAPRIAGKAPALDPLAAHIPADQHALFVPHLKAAGDLLGAYRRFGGPPALQVAAPTSEDAGIQARYERQLAFRLDDLRRLADLRTIAGLAVTGSDPYFPEGTDLAVLFETSDPGALVELLRSNFRAAREADPETRLADEDLAGVSIHTAVAPDRRTSAYVAALGDVVVLTNSRAQLRRIIEAARNPGESLAGLPEYRFFRDRYPRGDADETAFLVLSDATIRRWCGPRWRIAASRRVRAAAFLAEVQAEHVAAAVEGRAPRELKPPANSPTLGELTWTRDGVASTEYGSLAFQTPIVELPIEEVEQSEADAYGRWRDNYQRNWRGVFDPIAVRVGVHEGRLTADLTVMPLILASDYATFAGIVGEASIPANGGDPHPEALLHAVLAFDAKSAAARQGGDLFTNMTSAPRAVGLSWIGSSLALFADEGPFWEELGRADDPLAFLSQNFVRLPIALYADVNDPAKMALFLGALRAYAEQTVPETLEWTTLRHGERSYVRVAPREGAEIARGLRIYYAFTSKSLCISLDEDVIKRFLDRHDATNDAPRPAGKPWQGESLAFRSSGDGLRVLGRAGGTSFRDELQLRSWRNLPILNEWRRLYPDRDPVAVHEAVWGVRLVCPGGGRYVWNEAWQTLESTAYGCPAAPKDGPELPHPLAGIGAIDLGVTLRDGGLRGRAEVELVPEP